MATAPRIAAPSRDDFLDWLPSPLIRVAAYRQHDQWYAVAEDFNIVGVAATPAEAKVEVAQLVEATLRSYFRDGLTYRDAWRPIPWHTRAKHIVRGLIARGFQPIPIRVRLPFAEESQLLLPVALSNGHKYK
jgi:hypothetical protein